MTWPDVCEDTLTVKAPGAVTIRNITGKFAAATIHLSYADVDGAGKVLRENGGLPLGLRQSLVNLWRECVAIECACNLLCDWQCYGMPF